MRSVRRTMLVLAGLAGLVGAATAEAKIVTENVPYKDGDVALQGYLAYDDATTDPRPGVIVVHEWWGLNDFAKEQARRLAELGYVAFAVDMYGPDKVTTDPQQAGAWARELYGDAAKWRQRAQAGYDVLAADKRVDRHRLAAIGYCFGGATVQQMAWSCLDLQGVVSFHGSLVPPSAADAARTRARVLILHGAADTFTTPEQLDAYLDALRATQLDWQFVIYAGAKHGYMNPHADALGMAGVGYNARAAQRSWRAMRSFFGEIFHEEVQLEPSAP